MNLFSMWKNTRMIVLVAATAALYAAILIPFKAFPIIPSITEVRPAAAIPVVCSVLFGPPAAWGSAIGNLVGDIFGGTLTLGSIVGILGNFLYGLVPFFFWRLLVRREDYDNTRVSSKSYFAGVVVIVVITAVVGIFVISLLHIVGYYYMISHSIKLPPQFPAIKQLIYIASISGVISIISWIVMATKIGIDITGRKVTAFVLGSIASSGVCAIVIGYGVGLLGVAPTRLVMPAIFINNSIISLTLGTMLMMALYPVVHSLGLTYDQLIVVDRADERDLDDTPTDVEA